MVEAKLINNIFEFFKIAEKLKKELRHCYTSDLGRRESVAEHTWLMSLMVLIFADKLTIKIDKLRALKMAIIHDLGEAIAGDIPSHEVSKRQEKKPMTEKQGLQKLVRSLDDKTRKEIIGLWEEFEARRTKEAKMVYAFDKLECLFQHDITNISTWDKADYGYTFIDRQDTPFDFEPNMRQIKNWLDRWTYKKAKKAGTIKMIPKENLERFKKNQDREK